jgi:HlyD family secretion protein
MKKGCLIAAAIVFVIASIGLGYYFYKQSKKDPDVYQTENPVITDIVKKTVATGSINPRKEVQIKPQVSGVKKGKLCKKGKNWPELSLYPVR